MTMSDGPGGQGPVGEGPSALGPEPGYDKGSARPTQDMVGADLRKGDPDHRVLAGVCTGLGRYTGVDPIAWRTAFVLTAFAGAVGVLLYITSWMLMRDSQGGPSTLEQMLNRSIAPQAVPKLLAVGLTLSTGLSLIGGFGWGTMVMATPLVLGLLAARNRGVDLRSAFLSLREELRGAEPPPTPSSPGPSPTYYNPAQPWVSAGSGPVDLAVVAERGASEGSEDEEADEDDEGWGCRENGSGDEPGKRKKPKDTGCRGFSLAGAAFWTIVVGFVIAQAVVFGEGPQLWSARTVELWVGPKTGVYFLAAALGVVGLFAVVGTRWGRSSGLWALGVLLTAVMVLSTVTDLTQVRVGGKTWRPTTVAEAEEADPRITLGAGTLDLSGLRDLGSGQELELDVRVNGRTELILPEGAEVRLDSWVGLGGIVTPGEDLSGYGVHHEEVFGSAEEGADLPAVNVRTESYIGHVEVWYDQAQD